MKTLLTEVWLDLIAGFKLLVDFRVHDDLFPLRICFVHSGVRLRRLRIEIAEYKFMSVVKGIQ